VKVLVVCETSGVVRRAFTALGHDAYSCDLLPAEDGSTYHIKDDVRKHFYDGWDLAIFHPPCTRLCNSGVRWLSQAPPGRSRQEMWEDLDLGAALFSACWNAKIPRIAVENPRMHRYAKIRIINYEEPTQTLQPWQFGHMETKETCLWLKALPLLLPTKIEHIRLQMVHETPRSSDRWRSRSRTYEGIATAMAEQWGIP